MAWIIGIGIFLVLLFVFPKQIVGLILVVCFLIVVTILYNKSQTNSRLAEMENIATTVQYDANKCSEREHHIYLTVKNNTQKRVLSLKVAITAKRPGYSDDVAFSFFDTTKIIEPGQQFAFCASDNDDPLPRVNPNEVAGLIYSSMIDSADLQ